MVITIHVHYAPPAGDIVLRTSDDWYGDVRPLRVTSDGVVHTFEVEVTASFMYYKPVLYEEGQERWSVGHNYLVVSEATTAYHIYPHFREDQGCSVCDRKTLSSAETNSAHDYRIFYPPGYHENKIKRYPVLYMQDGQNLFFPQEAFGGVHWRIPETLGLLHQMNLVDRIIVVGIYPNERMTDYTQPGYEAYGRFLIETLKPTVDAEYRTLPEARSTAVMGSSLGGVVSFYLGWTRPDVFGGAACLSSTFGYQDDLIQRVMSESPRPLRVYLDTGWPNDNFEVNRSMRTALAHRGYQEGVDYSYLAFPAAQHNEAAWSTRVHIPFQFLFGKRPPVAESTRRESTISYAERQV